MSENTSKEAGTVTMVDVLEEEEEDEECANAVLGGSDAGRCTYDEGYVLRQALYACSTCTPTDKDPAGVCLACSYECHEGHELVELYTKRNFCCDCGNDRFPSHPCKFNAGKTGVNKANKYNQNFKGLYCTCHRPYPDPDDEVDDEMIQCIVCEDWFHSRHLGSAVPASDNYDEMICGGCMTKHKFLCSYISDHAEATSIAQAEVDTDVDVISVRAESAKPVQSLNSESVESGYGSQESCDSTLSPTEPCKTTAEQPGTAVTKIIESGPVDTLETNVNDGVACGTSGSDSENASKKVESACLFTRLPQPASVVKGATFWKSGWRRKLCTCETCKALYSEQDVLFLLDEKDTIHDYEEKGKRARIPHEEQGMQALAGMNRIQQIEMISGYNDLKSELSSYLKRFAENGKVVRAEDIKEFFEGMQARKRQRVSQIPANCR